MKKLLATVGILLLVTVLAAPVFADRWGNSGWGRGPGSCWRDNGSYGNLTENQSGDLARLEQKFYNDTAQLRDQIWSKTEELNTLLNSADPDVKKVKSLQKEITDLRAKMDRQRLDFELEARKIAPNGGYYGRGYSRGYGGQMMGGYRGGGYGHGPRH
ncbi:MAG: periplasmic heavy metal sensor [Syntrophobacterales bacterium]|jgi:zinc resistance-associated protein